MIFSADILRKNPLFLAIRSALNVLKKKKNPKIEKNEKGKEIEKEKAQAQKPYFSETIHCLSPRFL